MSVRIRNYTHQRLVLHTNTHLQISSPNPPMPNPQGIEFLGPEDEVLVDTEREVRIELRGDTLAVLV